MTLQLPDDLCTAAQQRAGVESKTLASWFTDLLRRELLKPASQPLSQPGQILDPSDPLPDRSASHSLLMMKQLPTADRLAELYDEATADHDFPLSPRSEDVSRQICFP